LNRVEWDYKSLKNGLRFTKISSDMKDSHKDKPQLFLDKKEIISDQEEQRECFA